MDCFGNFSTVVRLEAHSLVYIAHTHGGNLEEEQEKIKLLLLLLVKKMYALKFNRNSNDLELTNPISTHKYYFSNKNQIVNEQVLCAQPLF